MAGDSKGGKAEKLGISGLEDAELIGRGGAAVVYKATQSSLQRTVAVKLLTSSWDDSVARRFDREQRAMGRLSNMPGIVPVYESGLNDNGVPYIIMPYYSHGSLKDLSTEVGPMPWEGAAELILEVSEAVGRAHEEGVVHRDLKPANILLTGTGRPLLTDFGIARLASDSSGIETTAVTFTPAYCPPEVMDNAEPDPRADTYALAATFWALVAGRPPFTDSNTALAMDAVLKRVLTEPPPPLAGVPPELGAFIERAMSKEPPDRPADGYAFAAQMREAIAASSPGASYADSAAFDDVDATFVANRPTEARPQPENSRSRWLLPVAATAVTLIAASVAFAVLRSSGDDTAAGADTAETADGASTSSVVVVAPGENIQLLPLAAESLSSISVESRRATIMAARDFGPIEDFSVEVLATVSVDCSTAIGDDAETALQTTDAVVLVGSTCTESARSVMEAAAERGLSWVSSDLRSPTLTALADGTAGSDHVDGFFRTAQNDQFQGTVAAQFALDELGATSAVVVHDSEPGSAETAASFEATFGDAGDVTILGMADGTDLATIAEASTEADVAFWILDADAALALADAVDGRPGAATPSIIVGGALTSSTARQPSLVGSLVVIPLSPPGDSKAATGQTLNDLGATYAEEFGEPLDDELAFASAYDATILALSSVQATATASADGLTLDRRQLRTHLESATSEGLTGVLGCNYLGDCGSQAMAVVQVDGISITSTEENIVKLFDRAS